MTVQPHIAQVELLYFIGLLPTMTTYWPEAPSWVSLRALCNDSVLTSKDLDLFVPSLIARGWIDYEATLKAVRLNPAGRKTLAEALRPRG